MQLQQLTLVLGNKVNKSFKTRPQLGHLTNLQELNLATHAIPSRRSQLPGQLQKLKLFTHASHSDLSAFHITGLQELMHLAIMRSADKPQQLPAVASHP